MLEICYCEASTAAHGHIHEENGTILCLHFDGEDATDCPNNQPEVMR